MAYNHLGQFNILANRPRAKPIIVIPLEGENEVNVARERIQPPAVPIIQRPHHDPQRIPENSDNENSDNEGSDDENEVPAPVNRQVENLQEVYDNMTAAERDNQFWNMISRFQWRNSSDGHINARTIQNMINGYTPIQKYTFKQQYSEFYDMMSNKLGADGMFERNGIRAFNEQAKIISHAIAMGKDQFYTLLDDPAFFQFFIEMGECQSLDTMLPHDMAKM
ncbi:coiled coils domain protein [Pacmanvirus S19]|nr:coiled coils domain protein [Pacmanvirus S19]